MILDVRSSEYRSNPYPIFKRLRSHAAVCRVEPFGYWAVFRYEDVLKILKDPRTFSSAGVSERFVPVPGAEILAASRSLLGYDPPEHSRLRGLVNKAFTSSRVAAMESRIRELSRELIQEILAKGPDFDLIRDFSMPLPVTVISDLLGIAPERKEDFKRWSDTIVTWRSAEFITAPEVRRAREQVIVRDTIEMIAYFEESIADRRRSPQSDLISALVLACDEEEKLTVAQLQALIRLLLVAGNETTTNLIGNTILALLSHRDEWNRVRRERSLIPNLVEESLRFDGPVVGLLRRATNDVEIGGVRIARDEIVMPLVASANHDEARYPDPDRFDVLRETQGHLAFGAGIHFCVGAPLARIEARIAFEEIFDAFEDFERLGSMPVQYIDSFLLRGLKSLRLSYRPSETDVPVPRDVSRAIEDRA